MKDKYLKIAVAVFFAAVIFSTVFYPAANSMQVSIEKEAPPNIFEIFSSPYSYFSKGVHFLTEISEEQTEDLTAYVPIIMYHRVTKDSKSLGKFAISPEELEADFKYLKSAGYNSIFMEDLIGFVEKKVALPQNPVVITFDDGNYSDFKYLYPLLMEYEMKAVVSIIGNPTDSYSEDERNMNFPNLTWTQIDEMVKSGFVEIQNHSYDMHGSNGSKRLSRESVDDYKIRFVSDISKVQDRTVDMLGRKPTTFTYPLGKISAESDEILKELDFSASLSCYEGINKVTQGDFENLFSLKRCIRKHGVPVSAVLSRILNEELIN